MAEGRGGIGGGTGLLDTMLRNAAGALGLVAASSLVFLGIGMVGRADVDDAAVTDDTLADADDEQPATGGDGEDSGVDGAVDGPEDTGTNDGGADAAETGGDDAGGADDTQGGDAEGDDAAQDADESVEAPDEEIDDDADTEERIDPGTITVQVLDGYQADGGSAADAAAAELRDLGYDVVAENPALRYEATTVLWSPGGEEAARQVAAEIGAAEVRAQPGNLSEAVAVHVVIGADRG